MIYFCCDERRRNAVQDHATLNGIDFLEVLDDPTLPFAQRQRTLFVHFIKDLAPNALTREQVRIEGGERIRHVQVTNVTIGRLGSPPDAPAHVLVVEVAEAGDFSTYTLRLVQDAHHAEPPAGFDPILSAVDFPSKSLAPPTLTASRNASARRSRDSSRILTTWRRITPASAN